MKWRMRVGALLSVCTLGSGMAHLSSSVGAEAAPSLLERTREVQHLLDPHGSGRAWQAVTMTDPAGDNEPDRDPRGDIISGVFDQSTTFKITVRTRQPDNPTGRNWSVNDTLLAFGFETTGDEDVDFVGVIGNDGTRVLALVGDADGDTLCEATPIFDGTNTGLQFPNACIGSPTSFVVAAVMVYETDTTLSIDLAPDDAPGSTTPPPPTDVKPQGRLDTIIRSPGSVRAIGWAVDRNTQDPTAVHLYLNGEPVQTGTAQLPRPDVARVVPGFGENRGFDMTVPINTAGPHRLCAYGINNQQGSANTLLGCRAVLTAPFGRLDAIVPTAGGVEISGWAIDPDTSEPATLHVYIDGVAVSTGTAATARPDVAGAYPAYGANHGFAVSAPVGEGRHTICTYVIDGVIGSQNISLGCPVVNVSKSPFGSLDRVSRVEGGFQVAGWAVDPDVSGPVSVHVYADGRPIGAIEASGERPDLGARFPSFGSAHGFDQAIPGAGRRICVYAINQGAGSNALLGCKDV